MQPAMGRAPGWMVLYYDDGRGRAEHLDACSIECLRACIGTQPATGPALVRGSDRGAA